MDFLISKVNHTVNFIFYDLSETYGYVSDPSSKDYSREITKLELDLEKLQIAKTSCEPLAFYLTYHQKAINKYYLTLNNPDTKLLSENKSLILKEHVIKFNKIRILKKN